MKQSSQPSAERKKFKCRLCNWKFSRNFTPLLCPYCGKEAVVIDVPKTASQLIEEVAELRV